jgi:uncharacterized protein DUF5753
MADMSDRPRVTIEFVPTDVGAHVGLLGAFAIAGYDDECDLIRRVAEEWKP